MDESEGVVPAGGAEVVAIEKDDNELATTLSGGDGKYAIDVPADRVLHLLEAREGGYLVTLTNFVTLESSFSGWPLFLFPTEMFDEMLESCANNYLIHGFACSFIMVGTENPASGDDLEGVSFKVRSINDTAGNPVDMSRINMNIFYLPDAGPINPNLGSTTTDGTALIMLQSPDVRIYDLRLTAEDKGWSFTTEEARAYPIEGWLTMVAIEGEKTGLTGAEEAAILAAASDDSDDEWYECFISTALGQRRRVE